MNRSFRWRERGRIDAVDVGVGIVLAAGIPLLAFVSLKMLGIGELPQENEPIQAPPLDAEEVENRFNRIRRMYKNNAREFLERARQSTDATYQIHLMRWARTSLQKVNSELTNLQSLIRTTKASATFSGQLQEIEKLKREVEVGLAQVQGLELTGG